jgi:hypothetical protein
VDYRWYLVDDLNLTTIGEVKNISSYSAYGYSQVFIEFNQGVDIDDKINELREKVASIQNTLPSDSETPVVASFETNNSPILIINVTSDRLLSELKIIADNISDRLETESDIKDALVIGGLTRQINITVNPKLLYNYKISLDASIYPEYKSILRYFENTPNSKTPITEREDYAMTVLIDQETNYSESQFVKVGDDLIVFFDTSVGTDDKFKYDVIELDRFESVQVGSKAGYISNSVLSGNSVDVNILGVS